MNNNSFMSLNSNSNSNSDDQVTTNNSKKYTTFKLKPIDQVKPSLNLSNKLSLINKILNNNNNSSCSQIEPLIVLNSLQLINFINFYFNNDLEEKNFDNFENYTNTNLISICFPCIACSTKFTFEQTFHLHLDRRSILIRLYCMECNQYKTFFNKCKLFYHIYSHKAYLFEPIYKHIQIDQIPLDKCLNLNSQKHFDNLNRLFSSLDQLLTDTDSKCLNANLNLNLFLNKRFALNDSDLMQIKLFLKRFVLNKFLVYKCFICDALFFDLKELRIHFLSSKMLSIQKCEFKMLKEKIQNLHCIAADFEDNSLNVDFLHEFSFSRLQYSTKCSLLAQIDLIKKNFLFKSINSFNLDSLLICPECGLTFDKKLNKNYLNLFRMHLKYDCLFEIKYDLDEHMCAFQDCGFFF